MASRFDYGLGTTVWKPQYSGRRNRGSYERKQMQAVACGGGMKLDWVAGITSQPLWAHVMPQDQIVEDYQIPEPSPTIAGTNNVRQMIDRPTGKHKSLDRFFE